MKIGLFTDSLGDLSFEDALDWVVEHDIEAVEIGTGNFSPAPHCDVDDLIHQPQSRKAFASAIERRGLTLSALNCNGNLLDPDTGRGRNAQDVFRKTVQLAGEMGVATVVTMSGCPGDLGGGTFPNWVTCTWQREYVELLARQWDEVISPFWRTAGEMAETHGVRLAIEMHPGQAVYNTRTLQRLREIAGPENLGANLDPSHFFFQNMDPIAVIGALGRGAIFHVHAKDTRIDAGEMAINGSLDTRPMSASGVRSWEYVTLGYGHGQSFWRDFVRSLRLADYDGVLSIEHEDRMMSAREGITKSVEFLRPVVLRTGGAPESP